MKRHALHLLLMIAVFAIGGTSRASEPGYVVIVNANNTVTEIDRNFLRDAYLKKTTDWGRGTAIQPIDLASQFSARDQFIREVIRKTPAQLKNYWNQRIFSGKGVPPPETESASAVVTYVASHPGAIGYIPATVDPGKTKVIRIK